jgi:hypothetical protein
MRAERATKYKSEIDNRKSKIPRRSRDTGL